MSISQINLDLFQRSRSNYPQFWWAVLSFAPDILDDDGVWFTTTNNACGTPANAGKDSTASRRCSRNRISHGYYGSVAHRAAIRSDALSTHRAAEVLYPGTLTFEHLQAVYVLEAQHRRLIGAWCSAYGHPEMPVEINPDAFT